MTDIPQMPRKWPRRLFKVFGGLLAFAVVTIVLVLAVLSTSWGKERLRGFAETQLRTALIGGGQIGKIEGSVLGELLVRDLVLNDAHGRPAIRIAETRIRSKLLPLFGNHLHIEELHLSGLQVHARIDSNGQLNLAALVIDDGQPSALAITIDELTVNDSSLALSQPNQPGESLDNLVVGATRLTSSEAGLKVSIGATEARHRERGLDIALQGMVSIVPGRMELSLFDASVSGAHLRIDEAALDGNQIAELAGSLVVPASAVQAALPGTPWRLDSSLRFQRQGPSIALDGSIGTATLTGSATPPSQSGPSKISLALSTIDMSTLWPGLPSSALEVEVEASHEDAHSQAKLKLAGTVFERPLDAAEVSILLVGEKLKAEVELRGSGTSLAASADVQLSTIPRIIRSELVFRSGDLARVVTPWLDVEGDLQATLQAEGTLDTVRVSGSLQSTRLHAFGLEARGVTVQPDLMRRGDGAVGSLSASLVSLRSGATAINDIHLGFKSKDGQSARVQLSGNGRGLGLDLVAGLRMEDDALALDLERTNAQFRGLRLHDATGRLRWTFAGPQLGLVTVEDLQVRSSAGRLSASSAVLTGARVRGTIDLDAREIDLSAIARAAQLQVPLQGMLSMKAHIDTRKRTEGDLTVEFAEIGLGGLLPLTSGNLTLQLRHRTLMANLLASMPGAANLNAQAQVRVPRNPLDLSRWMRLDRRALLSLDASATANASAFAGLNEALPRSGQIAMRLNQEEGTQQLAVGLKARGLRNAHMSELAELDLQLDLEATKIASTAQVSLGSRATAKLAGALRLRGPWFASDSYQGLDADSLETLEFSTSEIDVDEFLRNLGLTVNTTGVLAQAGIRYAPATRSFEMDASAMIPRGGPDGRRPPQSLTLHASVGEREMSADLIGSFENSEKLRAEGALAMGWHELLRGVPNLGEIPISARLKADKMPLLALRDVLRSTPLAVESIASAPELSGTLSAQAKLSGRLSAPAITANASVHDVVVAGVAFARVAADGSLRDGTIDVNVVAAQVAEGELKLRATTTLTDGPSAAISAQVLAKDFDVGFLGGFAPGRAIGGLLTAKLQATGTRQQPVVRGNATLKNGSFNPGAPLHMVKDAEIHASLIKDTIALRGNFSSGRGSAKLSGAIELVENLPSDLRLTIETSKLPLAAGPINVRLDSRSQLEGRYERNTLKLALDIESATLNLPGGFARSLHPIDLPDDIVMSTGKANLEQSGSTPSVPIKIELAVRSKSNMLVKGGEANALVGVSLDLELGEEMQARGSVRVEQGWLELVGRRYRIQTAAASFAGDLDPSLNVQLVHEFDAITLFIDVSGLASVPVVEFRSEPSIYDTAELLAFVLGANPDQPEAAGTGVGQKAAGVATGLIAGQLSKIVTNATPLDLLRIDTDDSSPERVLLGKWITEKLLVAYRHRFTADARTNSDELVFEYRFLKRWLLEGFVGQRVIGADALWIHRY